MGPEPLGDGGHVADEAVEYVEGRLSAERAREVRVHLDACRACSEHVAFVARLRDDVVARRARHLTPERIVALAEDARALPGEDERLHLEACPDCRDEITWARAAEAPRSSLRFRPPWRVPAWGWGAALAAAAAVVLVISVGHRGGGSPYADLAENLPLPPAEVARGAEGSAAFRQAFGEGMSAYEEKDYPRAARELGTAAAAAPGRADVRIYLGSALLLAHRPDEAATILRQAVDAALSPREQEESRWQLANALLLLDRPDPARALLREVIALDLERRGAAEALLRAIDREGSGRPRGGSS